MRLALSCIVTFEDMQLRSTCIDLLWIAEELEGQSTEKLEEGGTATGLEEYLHHIPHATNIPHTVEHHM